MAVHTPKNLAFAQLASAKASLYTAPTGKKALIHNIVLHNAAATAYAAYLYINNGTNSYRIWASSGLIAGNTAIIDFGNEGLVLEPGWILEGYAGAVSSITIAVSGMERA